jgi:hypothetical protein
MNLNDFQETATAADVLRYLQERGFTINRRTFFNHAKAGKLRKNADGLYNKRMAEEYCRTWLKPQHRPKQSGDEDEPADTDWAARKLRAEAQKAEIAVIRAKHDLEIQQSKFMSREEVEFGLAGRVIILESLYEHMVYTQAARFIDIVEGDQGRVNELIEAMFEGRDEWFNAYADSDEYEITYTGPDIPE